MAANIYQLKIELIGIKPKIWRRLLVPSDILLSNFHKIIQTAMGWTNSHLHQFTKNRINYSESIKDDWSWDELDSIDYKKIKLSVLLATPKDKLIYEYDFGDGWEHVILLEKILPSDEKFKNPICLEGERNCPPEDCGGIWGYAELLQILSNPQHPEYESYIEWLDEDFDPEDFDIDYVNKLLRLKNYGC